MKLVCVDEDYPGLKEILKKCRGLTDVGEASGFSNGSEAVDWYLNHSYDVAILDIDEDKPRVRAKTFGNFELFCDGEVVKFHRSRSISSVDRLLFRQYSKVQRLPQKKVRLSPPRRQLVA